MKTREELGRLFDGGEQAFLVTTRPFSREAVLIYCNEAAALLLGEPREALAGRKIGSLAAGWRDGKEVYSSTFDGDLALSVIVDLSDAKRAAQQEYEKHKQEMERTLEAANIANKAKTKFLSEMSHDIRTPMNAIIGMTDIALNHAEDQKRVEDCLKKIQTASGHLLRLINEVLDMSRIESGKLVLVEEKFQLADLIHEVFIVIKAQAEKKKIDFKLELGEIPREELTGDRLRIQQIYINVLSNAVKYTQEGGYVRMKLWQEETEGGRVEQFLTVQDNGIGMAPEFVQQIFEPFERERNTTFSGIEGAGLGLSITKKLVDMMQGHISVESSRGKGSRFDIDFPLAYSESEKLAENGALAGKRVLILTGVKEKFARLPEMLEKLGMEADTASCGMEAIDLLNDADITGKDYFALLANDKLADLELSLLLPEIRARKGKDFPMLLLSESDWTELEYLMQQAGITSFVPLPLFESRLAEALFAYTEAGKKKQERRPGAERHYEDCHILLVEDNDLNLEIAVEILKSTGAAVDTARDGQEALDAFSAKPAFYYDLILMDIQMPVMDGLEATRRIRALSRPDAATVHIVAMTANAFVEDRQRSVQAGMNAHIAKPLDVEQVLECLDKWGGKS
ncbi:MAG: response regulator [Roseburia sp.]|nr:response regulator [Roseburia sp.]MCM1097971.1 response regulator [Ruminococcus flavefaciens]